MIFILHPTIYLILTIFSLIVSVAEVLDWLLVLYIKFVYFDENVKYTLCFFPNDEFWYQQKQYVIIHKHAHYKLFCIFSSKRIKHLACIHLWRTYLLTFRRFLRWGINQMSCNPCIFIWYALKVILQYQANKRGVRTVTIFLVIISNVHNRFRT